MFDGFGLFGTGIGTGLFGALEDLYLGAKGGVEDMGRNLFTKSDTDSDVDTDEVEIKDLRIKPSDASLKTACDNLESVVRLTISKSDKEKKNIETAIKSVFGKSSNFIIGMGKNTIYTVLEYAEDGMNMVAARFAAEYKTDHEKALRILSEEYDKFKGRKVKNLEQAMADGISANVTKYLKIPDDVKNIITDIDSGKITAEQGFGMLKQLAGVDNITITIDAQKMIWDYLRKRQGGAIADSTEKDDNSGRLLLDKVNKQPSEMKVQFQDALAKAKTAALEEIQCFEEMAAFAKKKGEGRLTQADLEEMEKKLPVWKQCLVKAKEHVSELLMTRNPEAENSEVEKSEITFEDFEEALHYAKEQISSL